MQDQFTPPQNLQTADVPTVTEALRILRRAADREGLAMNAEMTFSPYRSRYEIHLNPRLDGKKEGVRSDG